jgi:hypothetical protein
MSTGSGSVELSSPTPGAARSRTDQRLVGEDADGRDERREAGDDAVNEIGIDAARTACPKIEPERIDAQVDGFLRVPPLGDAADLDDDPGAHAPRPVAMPARARKFASSLFPESVRIDSGWNCTPWSGSDLCLTLRMVPSSA